jgi:hypothetical protein
MPRGLHPAQLLLSMTRMKTTVCSASGFGRREP